MLVHKDKALKVAKRREGETGLVIVADQVCFAHLEEYVVVDDGQVAMLSTSTDDGKALFLSFGVSQQTRTGAVRKAGHVAHELLQDQAVAGSKVKIHCPNLLRLRVEERAI